MVNTWKYTMKDISKMPNLKKEFKKKYILLTDSGSFPTNTKEEAMRYVRNTPVYRRRVNKPTIKISIR